MRARLLGLAAIYAGACLAWWSLWWLNRELLPTRMFVPAWDQRAVAGPAWTLVGVGILVLLVRIGMVAVEERKPPAPTPAPFRLPTTTCWRDPIMLGKDMAGEPVLVGTWNVPQWLIGGTSGSGKTVAMRMILAHYALDPTAILWGVDGKGNRDDWAGMRPRFDRWVSATDRLNGPRQYLEMLEDLGRLIDERQDIAGRDYPGMLVLMDDAPQLRRRLAKPDKARADDLLTGIVQTCRAVNVMVLTTTQKPSHKQIDTDQRSQAGIALCMQMDSLDDARMVLGVRPEDDAVLTLPIGQGLLKAERGKPRRIAVHHLTDAMWAQLGQRFAAELPQDVPAIEPQGVVVETIDPLVVAVHRIVADHPQRRMTTEAILAAQPSLASSVAHLGRALTAAGWPARAVWVDGATAKFRFADDAPLRQPSEASV